MGPVESHVGSVLQNVVVRVAHHLDVAVAGGALGAQGLEGVLGVLRIACKSGFDLFVDDDVDLDAGLCSALEHLVKPPLLVAGRGAAEEQLWRQPPVCDVYRFPGVLERHRHRLAGC